MTKRELINTLSSLTDDAEIEINHNDTWYELDNVVETDDGKHNHALLYTGKVTLA